MDVRTPREGRSPKRPAMYRKHKCRVRQGCRQRAIALGRRSRRGPTSSFHGVVPPAIHGGRLCSRAVQGRTNAAGGKDAESGRQSDVCLPGEGLLHPWRASLARARVRRAPGFVRPCTSPLAKRESIAARDCYIPIGHKKPGSAGFENRVGRLVKRRYLGTARI